jgi:hypothetical protein
MLRSQTRTPVFHRMLASVSDARATRELAKANLIRVAYLKRHGLRPFANRYRNILMVLKQSGASKAACEAVASRLTRCDYKGGALNRGAFDHGEVLGRDGKPTRLLGYPYHIQPEDYRVLDAIHALGLTVLLHTHSNYGFRTYQVEVFAVPDPLPGPYGV